MVDVPLYVENEGAYIEGARRRIQANARKTRDRVTRERLANEPEFAALVRFIAVKSEKGNKFFSDMRQAFEEWGGLSEKQEAACLKIMREENQRKAEIRQRDAGSEHVGTEGKREIFTLTVTGIAPLESFYGDQFLHFMKDAAGNVVVYKGANKIAEKGETITVKATVKSHGERDGVKQTNISRPAIVENHGTPYQQGQKAYRDAAGMSANPYHWEDGRHTSWNKGFEDEMDLEIYPA